MTDKSTNIPEKEEACKIYKEFSERDQSFLKAILEMLVAIYCTPDKNQKTEKR
ncbi:MAG: hypothetical protein K2K16_03860 [Ruminococcus sp.]|nr:hypothetical protein [Ruminococcus sp.]